MFESPKNRAIFSLTNEVVKGIRISVKHIASNSVKQQLPFMAAELGDREVLSAAMWRHISAAVSGSFFALGVEKGGGPWNT